MKRLLSAAVVIAVGATLLQSATTASGATSLATAKKATVAAMPALPSHAAVITATRLAANYYRSTYAHTALQPTDGWSWSTYAQGVQALYRQSGDTKYLNDDLAWGQSNGWGRTSAETDPDTMKAAETYYDLHAIDPTASLSTMDAAMAADLSAMPLSQYDWIDALFMGLPNWTRWAARTGDTAYLSKLDALYEWMRDDGATSSRCSGAVAQTGLFDASQGLWYRDCSFVGVQDKLGKPIFWSRGNGWVIAAMAQVLESMPSSDPSRATYAGMLQTLAASLRPLQGADGFWRASLADTALYPQPETSGTALITYALAYGIKSGILDTATYLPVVARAWQGLSTVALQPNGFVTDCQGPGVSPAAAYTAKAPKSAPTSASAGSVNTDSPPYCVGALLLAGSAVATLTASPSTGRPVAFSAQQVGNEASRVDDGDVTTRWSASGFPQTVTIDLGAAHQLSNAMVVSYLDRAYRYRIETSTDKVHWQKVVDRTANKTAGTLVDNFTKGAVSARYTRLTVTGVYGAATTWVSIDEFAVY